MPMSIESSKSTERQPTMLDTGVDGKRRCFGNGPGRGHYAEYHDDEWGVPVHDDRVHFEFIVLEGAQAGLNWETILKKRSGYRKAFKDFSPARVALMSDTELEALRSDPGIVRNRLKIESARRNARVFLRIQEKFGSFDSWLWEHVDGKPVRTAWQEMADMPATTPLSDSLSRELKLMGMNFVGSTIVYAFLQAVGVVNDHVVDCWKSDG